MSQIRMGSGEVAQQILGSDVEPNTYITTMAAWANLAKSPDLGSGVLRVRVPPWLHYCLRIRDVRFPRREEEQGASPCRRKV